MTATTLPRYGQRHILARLKTRLDEQRDHYRDDDGVPHCDGHVCQPGKHARAES